MRSKPLTWKKDKVSWLQYPGGSGDYILSVSDFSRIYARITGTYPHKVYINVYDVNNQGFEPREAIESFLDIESAKKWVKENRLIKSKWSISSKKV